MMSYVWYMTYDALKVYAKITNTPKYYIGRCEIKLKPNPESSKVESSFN